MTNDELTKFFAEHEWYDNSRVKMIRGCKRKAFFQLIGPPRGTRLVGPRGTRLEAKVGDGANFGSAFHAGLARYFNGWHSFDESTRRVHAARAFAEEWSLYFPTDRMQTKHTLDRGLTILDAYFDHYLDEDKLFEPVETELGFCVEMRPNVDKVWEQDNQALIKSGSLYIPKLSEQFFDPFWYIGRVDGIFKRIATGELYLRETKTTSSQAEARLRQLRFDHQPLGYTACVRQLADPLAQRVSGFIGDVILVAANKLEFARDYFTVTDRQAESWRRQLINTVEDWRALIRKSFDDEHGDPHDTAQNKPHDFIAKQGLLDNFYQDTERCFEYGKCSFYDLCQYGINDDTLNEFAEATWNPLLKRTPARIEIA